MWVCNLGFNWRKLEKLDEIDHNWKNWKTSDQNGKDDKVWKYNSFNWGPKRGEKIGIKGKNG